jgi:nicotinate-nucleotide adenylyltransferase
MNPEQAPLTSKSTLERHGRSERVGVMGGAFDPPHLAHRALAQAARHELNLDELRIFPTGQAWHKSTALSAPHHRLAMAERAFAGLPGVVVDDAELRRTGPTYTLDTLQALQRERPQAQLFLIIGADQARSFERWHGWQDILRVAILAVAERDPAAGEWHNPGWDPVIRLHMPLSELSATEIRQRCQSGLPIDTLVPPGIADYIAQHGLYAAHS